MNKKFTIISRDELIKLYKFGSLNIICTHIIDEDKDTSENLTNALEALSFDDDIAYIILKFIYIPKQMFNTVLSEIKIDDVESIYTLSSQAKQWYSVKFNPKIQFHEIENINLQKILEKKEIINMENGAKSIFKMFRNSLINQDAIEGYLPVNLKQIFFKNHSIEDYWNEKYQNFYLDLMLYKRENTFKEEDISFIYDILILLILKGRDPKKLTKYMQGELKLNGSDYHSTAKDLYLKNEENAYSIYENIKLLNNYTDEYIDINNLVVGIIFLKILKLFDIDYGRKGRYKEEIQNIVSDFTHEYKKQLSIALYLVGIYFGYKNLYDEYYDFLDLNIFNLQKINTKKELTVDEFKNKIFELEKKLEKYNKEDNQTTQIMASGSSTLDDFEINVVSSNDNTEINNSVDREDTDDVSVDDKSEDNITSDNALPNEEIESIKDFLNYLNEEALANIWMKAGSKTKKDITNEPKEKLIDNIMEHESSCVTIKELLQTFYHDVLVFVLFSTDKKKFQKNKLKLLGKEKLINELMTAYKFRVT